MRLLVIISALLGVLVACTADTPPPALRYETTLQELALENARRCDSGFEYPASLVDGISQQLVEELRCLDDSWLEFYEACREPGCIWPDGPQPHALRPEVVAALGEAARSVDDFISITAGYRDIAMQYYSRWYNEHCDASFDAAVPGRSNHQGGRAVDVRYWSFWWDTLLANGFEHPIETDNPHFELRSTAAYRAESEELKRLSITAFQRLWNRNNLDDPISEDGVYGSETKTRLGWSPVEGFPLGACAPGSGGADPPPDAGGDDTGTPDAGGDGTGTPDAGGDDTGTPDAGGDDTGTPDAGRSDAGGPDTSVADTGPEIAGSDGGRGSDAEEDDVGPTDIAWSDVASGEEIGEIGASEELGHGEVPGVDEAGPSSPDGVRDGAGLLDAGEADGRERGPAGSREIELIVSAQAGSGPSVRGCTTTSGGASPAGALLGFALLAFGARRSR